MHKSDNSIMTPKYAQLSSENNNYAINTQLREFNDGKSLH